MISSSPNSYYLLSDFATWHASTFTRGVNNCLLLTPFSAESPIGAPAQVAQPKSQKRTKAIQLGSEISTLLHVL
ncbi:hypothetical protein PanWU01x14_198120 [Parasponia andersonii]|uniref:Uncharacterized protein n=1 Tax=Parasponia andersonii TaxID=3476 RepID=A0A2P5BZ47_PARAD|nr:hypothetical protein PanWU01x14_198120 [Parasponia andersonii]